MTVRIMIGDVREELRKLPSDFVDCVVTSPPYWGLRNYGVEGQIGMEPTLGEHITTLVDVFNEVHRVMKPKAALWINYGDCYATTPNGRSAADTKAAGNDDRTFRDKPFSTIQGVLKPKDLCLIPFRLAIALQEEGWWVRSRCIWGKPNGMPDSSGRYRPSVAHEEIFLLSKSGDLEYDFEAVKAPPAESSMQRWSQDVGNQEGSDRANGGRKTNGKMKAVGGPHKNANGHSSTLQRGAWGRRHLGNAIPEKERRSDKQCGHSRRHQGFNERWGKMTKSEQQENGRLLRTYEPEVWHIATAAFSEAHFATFPPALVERCLMATSKEGQTVLDPFGGAGTTGLVADRMGRDAILIELNPEYAEIARDRIKRDAGMFGEIS
jgi:DNA modification methylase